MSIKKTSKIVAGVIGFTMALTVVAGASTASAQAMSLSDLVNLFISLGIISPDKAAAAKAAVSSSSSAMVATFSKDLTVGSSGADVTALQTSLKISPATGYFGSITKAAVIAYQKSNGLPSTGYVGPLTRAQLNKSSTMTTTTGTTTTTTTTTTGTTGTVAVNSGVEGILTVDQGSVSNSTLYEGQTMVPVLSVKLGSKLSDINIQRIQLDLGTNTTIYTKVFKTMYVTDDSGKVLAQADLNSNTVVKSGGEYLLTLGGFSYNVVKDSTKYLTVKADLYSSIKSADLTSRTITLAINGVRGTDGAGIDQYGPAAAISQVVSLSGSLTDSAQLLVSTDGANFLTADVVAAGGANNNEFDKLSTLAFDVRAQKDAVQITDLTATTTVAGGATVPTAYLYDGSTLLQSASVTGGVAKFTNINYWVPQDTTKVLTIKVDVRNAVASASTVSTAVSAIGPAAQNTQGSTIVPTGTGTGNTFTVRNVGPVFTLLSKSISVSGVNNTGSTLSTSTITATFSLQVQAVGGDISFGNQASTTFPMFGFRAYNSAGTEITGVSSTTGFTIPSTGVNTSGLTNSFTLSQNNTVTLNPITVTIDGKDTAGNPRVATAVAIDAINWQTTAGKQTSTFMSGKTDWRTNTQTP